MKRGSKVFKMGEKKQVIAWENRGFSFLQNTKCEYFPCHITMAEDMDDFNCIFCFCPLYQLKNCGGVYVKLGNGHRDCSACIKPHRKENYGAIIERLQNASVVENMQSTT